MENTQQYCNPIHYGAKNHLAEIEEACGRNQVSTLAPDCIPFLICIASMTLILETPKLPEWRDVEDSSSWGKRAKRK
eukprot:scaffold7029_cov100-Cylindrotheca_fusiformis.AAC.2